MANYVEMWKDLDMDLENHDLLWNDKVEYKAGS